MEQEILQLFAQNNSPFSLQTVINFTASKYSKTFVQRALDKLVADQKVTFLQVGKSGKLYVYNQALITPIPEGELDALKQQNADYADTIKALQADVAQLKAEQTQLQNVKSEAQLRDEVAQVQKRLSLITVTEADEVISNEQMTGCKKMLKKLLVEWKTRQVQLFEGLDAIGEGLEKSRTQLFKELDMEPTETPKQIKDRLAMCQ
ncbi:Tat binding protein 1(TBP-1)-interacting protein [Spironucleus salmonicida]|uniref:Tat binding protein 1(TBP-1)-interacting protein n=1 Tax=Spironucleus salmonicida TaxID=348837 RepID=V6LK93_9EUKA|nr:Tat binding protein 1(TBP-1)-interacting protein [Spironucleus salmonicida]|eukprot:EST44748.1 Tat binding protein 1(TBP-1)-interacting protein [Spironucleus salmonicida]